MFHNYKQTNKLFSTSHFQLKLVILDLFFIYIYVCFVILGGRFWNFTGCDKWKRRALLLTQSTGSVQSQKYKIIKKSSKLKLWWIKFYCEPMNNVINPVFVRCFLPTRNNDIFSTAFLLYKGTVSQDPRLVRGQKVHIKTIILASNWIFFFNSKQMLANPEMYKKSFERTPVALLFPCTRDTVSLRRWDTFFWTGVYCHTVVQ